METTRDINADLITTINQLHADIQAEQKKLEGLAIDIMAAKEKKQDSKALESEASAVIVSLQSKKDSYFEGSHIVIKNLLEHFKNLMEKSIRTAVEENDQGRLVNDAAFKKMLDDISPTRAINFKRVEYVSHGIVVRAVNDAIQKLAMKDSFKEMIYQYVKAKQLLTALESQKDKVEKGFAQFKLFYDQACQEILKKGDKVNGAILVAALDERVAHSASLFSETREIIKADKKALLEAQTRKEIMLGVDAKAHLDMLNANINKLYEQNNPKYKSVKDKDAQRKKDFGEMKEGDLKKHIRILEMQAAITGRICAKAKQFVEGSGDYKHHTIQQNAKELQDWLEKQAGFYANDKLPKHDELKGVAYKDILKMPILAKYRPVDFAKPSKEKPDAMYGQYQKPLDAIFEFVEKNAPKAKVAAEKETKKVVPTVVAAVKK